MLRLTSVFRVAHATAVRKAASATKAAKAPSVPLAQSHPLLVSMWMGAATGKFDSPQTLNPNSCRLSWWRCGACEAQFRRRIVDHVMDNGKCPHCAHIPTEGDLQQMKPIPTAEIAARPIRTKSTTIAAHNPSSIKKHITDIPFFAGTAADTPTSSTTLRKMLQPMLAHAFEDSGHMVKFGKEPVFVSPKLDGIRCLVAYDPTPATESASSSSYASDLQGTVYYFTRQGMLLDSCDHLDDAMRRVFAADPTAILDGELYYNGPTPTSARMPFEELMSVVRTTKAHRRPNVEALQRLVQYHAFDVAYSETLFTNGIGKGFADRYDHLQQIIGAGNGNASSELIRVVEHIRISTIVEAFEARDTLILKGFEGAMLRRGNGPYAHGKRSSHLLKMKTMQDAEFKIIGALEGNGKMANSLGAFVCQTERGDTFTVSPSLDEQRRRALWLNVSAVIGSALTVQFQELSSQGIPRFPVGKAIRGSSMSAATWL